jgi:glyoxylase-like metal-dependent hydrolase (beta-lactamase superfamily II)
MAEVRGFYDSRTSTMTYVVWDSDASDAVIIDPVLDYDAASAQTWTESVDEITEFVRGQRLTVHWVLETHAHADHLSGSQLLLERFDGAKLGIGNRITEVQETFKQVFGLSPDFPTDGRQFSRLLQDGETLEAGALRIEVVHTPGHTPACATYAIGDALFTGDALFMPDMGTGRCDFPAGSARDLYQSVHERIYSYPDATRLFVGHDYQPGGRELAFETTVGAQKRGNKQLTAETSEEEFVRFRTERDAHLSAPKLMLPSVQVNIDAGRLPAPDAEGRRFLRIPVTSRA